MKRTLEKKMQYNVLLLCFLVLTSCDPITLMVGGSLLGATAIRNDEGLLGSLSDAELQTKINKDFFVSDDDLLGRIELCLKHGRVVIIGYMENEEQCVRAWNRINSIRGSTQVYNEIKVDTPPSGSEGIEDAGRTSRIKTSLTFDGNVQSLNYDVTTVKGVVYICGVAQTKYERDVVLNHARTTSGVEKVISYIRIKLNEAEPIKLNETGAM